MAAAAPTELPSRRRQRRLLPRLALLAAAAGALLAAGPAVAPPPPARGAAARAPGLPPRRRREVALSLAAPAVAGWPLAAAAESGAEQIIAESRRKAKEDASKPSVWNWNYYKTPTQNYNSSDLQSFLPTLFLARRSFETISVQLDNPRVNVSDPNTYEILREQNRLEPTKLLRKDSFRTKMWLRDKTKQLNAADTEYERMKRALDEEDTQCLLLSRIDGTVEPAAWRTAKRNVEAVVDAIDQLLELLPEEEQVVAKVVADTKTIPVMKLPVAERYKAAGGTEEGTTATGRAGSSAPSAPSAPAAVA